jgi:hypothetical protein
MKTDTSAVNIDRDVGDFHYKVDYGYDAGVGLDERVVNYISDVKQDPDWVREFRLKALQTFESKPLPTHWASKDLEAIDFNKIRYYLAQGQRATRSWDEVPEDVKRTFERLGIPEQERKFLAGVEAQFDSEAVYSNIKKAVGEQGVIFVGSTEGLKEHPEIFRRWFGKVIPTGDNKFSALNSAVFSGGSFIYVPPGVKVKHPLQAYFRINAENFRSIRAHAHHLRRRLRADLHGRLHRPEVQHRHLAQRGRRAHRAQRREAPIHHGAKLVAERFQSCDQTRARPRGIRDQMDRLQYRFATDHEISRCGLERTQGPGAKCCRSRWLITASIRIRARK